MSITVRSAALEDLDAVIAVGHRTWPSAYEPIAGAEYVRRGLAKWWTADATRPGIEAGRVLVAESDGSVVGMAGFGPVDDAIVLWKLYVVPEAQGTGAGSALMREVIARASRTHKTLRLEFVEGNTRAEAFYRSHGFQRTGREPGPLEGPDDIWMSLDLGAVFSR